MAPHYAPPPQPFLTRFNVFDAGSKAEIVDSFFEWYSNFPAKQVQVQRQQTRMEKRPCIVEVACHGEGDVGMASAGKVGRDHDRDQGQAHGSQGYAPDPEPVYFVQDPLYEGTFESVHYERGRDQRTQSLELLNSTLLKCKGHGTSWEVNVLGQKQVKEDETEREGQEQRTGGSVREMSGTRLELVGHPLRLGCETRSLKEKRGAE